MPNRDQDWFRQACRDLEQASDSQRSDRHEWACLASQQAAEKAANALHLNRAQEAWGHAIARLLEELPSDIACSADMVDKARVLDAYYIGARYANGHPEGAPFEHYGRLQSTEAIRYAGEIIDFVRAQMAGRGDSP